MVSAKLTIIDLAQRSEPHEIALPYGLTVTVRPLTTAGMTVARAAAQRAVEAIERQARSAPTPGWSWTGCPTSRLRARATASTRRN
jgi:hypothetical protein